MRPNPDARRRHPVDGEAATVTAWRPVAHAIARDYFFPGGDSGDVRQEAMIGLLVAVRDYDGRSEFGTFARHVIHSWLQTRVKLANRQKHRPLNDAAAFTGDDGDLVVDPVDDRQDVVDILDGRHRLQRIAAAAATLTPLERATLAAVANGDAYTAGSVKDKRADNAVERARRKLREVA